MGDLKKFKATATCDIQRVSSSSEGKENGENCRNGCRLIGKVRVRKSMVRAVNIVAIYICIHVGEVVKVSSSFYFKDMNTIVW